MSESIRIKNALISVYNKVNIDQIALKLNELGIEILSTGGTQEFIEKLGIKVRAVENLTSYPSILGGRVKTLHPKIFGGILSRRELPGDLLQLEEYEIPEIDLVIVDLYPFEETLKKSKEESEIIEKIDIGGVSLIRAAAKNFRNVVVISSPEGYPDLLNLLNTKKGNTDLEDRKRLAAQAFDTTSNYDTSIFNFFNQTEKIPVLKEHFSGAKELRYGENPHQQGIFFGPLEEAFEVLNGKELSYNNLLDIDAGVNLISDFTETTFAILKHNNACGLASRNKLTQAWSDALAGDPISAFGGILVTNRTIDQDTATEINKLFFEVIIAPDYAPEALTILKQKNKRILLKQKKTQFPGKVFRSLLNGVIQQDKDQIAETSAEMKVVTQLSPTDAEKQDLEFANKIVKHSKSNAIVLVKNKQLIASGVGQTSRVDALKHAIQKAQDFKFDLKGAVMASDAFFPFPDCVEIAGKAGIRAVIQPGGSIKDNESIDYCNAHTISMVMTGIRHFKH